MSENTIQFFKIQLAGLNIEIECNYKVILAKCSNYLTSFDQPDFVVGASMEEIKSARPYFPDIDNHDPRIAIRYTDEYIEPNIVFEKIAKKMISYNTLLMHGAVVATDNSAYMFTAAKGVGKTTRARIWLNEYPESMVINGDKPFIKITSDSAIACGSPWCGKEGWNTNVMVPLSAIFLLERSTDNHKNSIEEISIGDAFPTLLKQTYLPEDRNDLLKTIRLISSLGEKVRLFKFQSTPTPEAIHLAFEAACQ